MRATVRCELYQSRQPCVANYIATHACLTTRDRHRYTHVGPAGAMPNNTLGSRAPAELGTGASASVECFRSAWLSANDQLGACAGS
eukprot:8069448-Alexandrium_andersonii.AAC.1